MVNAYSYDPFGAVLSRTEAFSQPFQYVGQYGVMAESCELNAYCLLYMKARYYDPNTGRFISEDPIGFEGGDVNLYNYVGGNPVNRIDPFGLAACDPVAEKNAIVKRISEVENQLKKTSCGKTPTGTFDYGTSQCTPFGALEPKIRQGLSPCIRQCVELHETIHVGQCYNNYKEYSDKRNEADLENEAYAAELRCLQSLLK